MMSRTKKSGSRLVNFHCPDDLKQALQKGVQKTDSDKSKFIRNAVREKLARHGITLGAA